MGIMLLEPPMFLLLQGLGVPGFQDLPELSEQSIGSLG